MVVKVLLFFFDTFSGISKCSWGKVDLHAELTCLKLSVLPHPGFGTLHFLVRSPVQSSRYTLQVPFLNFSLWDVRFRWPHLPWSQMEVSFSFSRYYRIFSKIIKKLCLQKGLSLESPQESFGKHVKSNILYSAIFTAPKHGKRRETSSFLLWLYRWL